MENMNTTPQVATRNNKTIIILIVLIILAAVTLAILLSRQSSEENQNVTPDTTTTNPAPTAPIEPPTRFGMRPREVPIPEIQVTQAQLQQNSSIESCWTVVDGVVYDMSESIRRVRRFVGEISEICGKDGKNVLTEGVEGRPPLESMSPNGLYSRPVGKLQS